MPASTRDEGGDVTRQRRGGRRCPRRPSEGRPSPACSGLQRPNHADSHWPRAGDVSLAAARSFIRRCSAAGIGAVPRAGDVVNHRKASRSAGCAWLRRSRSQIVRHGRLGGTQQVRPKSSRLYRKGAPCAHHRPSSARFPASTKPRTASARATPQVPKVHGTGWRQHAVVLANSA